MFITLEGIDGSGKSTQSKMLFNYFCKNNLKTFLTKEPDGTNLGSDIKQVFLKYKNNSSNLCSFLMMCASRLDHIEKIIKPKLAENIIVISDRFIDSSAAYQGHNIDLSFDVKLDTKAKSKSNINEIQAKLDLKTSIDPLALNQDLYISAQNQHLLTKDILLLLAQDPHLNASLNSILSIYNINSMLTNIMPDITFLLDTTLENANFNLQNRSHHEKLNILDLAPVSYKQKVLDNYNIIANLHKDRIIKINANDTMQNIHLKIIGYCNEFIAKNNKL